MPGVLESIRQSHPSSLWMLRDTDITPATPPSSGGIAATSGMVFGEASLVEIFSADGRVPPSGPQWVDWSWNSNRNWSYKTTDSSQSFLAIAPQQTVGPYGLKYDATVGSDNGLQLHTDTPYDTTNDSVFLFYVKKNLNNEGLRIGFTDASFADLGTSVDLVTITGTLTAGSSKVLTDSTKAWITDAHVRHVLTITGGTGAGQSQEIWANTATTMTPRFSWGTAPTAGSTYQIDAFWPDSRQMQPIMLTLRGTSIAGTKGNFNLPSGALVAQIYVVSLGGSTQTIYFDEMQFLQQRARSVPLITGTRPEIRGVNTPYNYMPQILTRHPLSPHFSDLPDSYLAQMDGNCAGTTEEIMEWAATKWFGDLFGAWTAAGGPGSLADLGKAISRQETQWNQYEHQGWEIWGDHSGYSSPGIYTLGTTGIGQIKSSLWPYYPHVRLSTGWAAECHMLVLRWLVDGGASWVSMSGLSLIRKVRKATGYWASGIAGVNWEQTEYACRALGGTVSGDPDSSKNGRTFVGQINMKPWLTMIDGEEFPYEDP